MRATTACEQTDGNGGWARWLQSGFGQPVATRIGWLAGGPGGFGWLAGLAGRSVGGRSVHLELRLPQKLSTDMAWHSGVGHVRVHLNLSEELCMVADRICAHITPTVNLNITLMGCLGIALPASPQAALRTTRRVVGMLRPLTLSAAAAAAECFDVARVSHVC